MKEIALTQGFTAKVDDCDYAKVSKFKWCANKGSGNKTPYAVRGERLSGKLVRVSLHRMIARAEPGDKVEFVNGDTLDCRRENLVVYDGSYLRHPEYLDFGASKYKGVAWYDRIGMWVAVYNLSVLGLYGKDREDAAAIVYNISARSAGVSESELNKVPGYRPDGANRIPEADVVNKYRGVRRRSHGSFEASVQVEGKRYVIGYYPDEGEAVRAYNNECDRVGVPGRKNRIA
jgi:hypothetical protein